MFSTALKVRSLTSKIPKTPTSGNSKNTKDHPEERESSPLPRRQNGGLRERIRRRFTWRRRFNRKRCAVTWLIVLLVGATVGVMFYYFNYVRYAEYYEYGLLKETPFGTIDPSWVYWNQWVTRGPSWGMVMYPATAQLVVLTNLSVATLDQLGISLSLTFQYYLRRWDIPALHKTYRLNFSRPIVSQALDSIKEVTPKFDSRMFLTDRATVAAALFEAVRWRIEGRCCLVDCGKNETRPCKEGCIPRENCNSTDYGVYAEVKKFFLLGVNFPEGLQKAFLKNVVTNVTLETVEYSLAATRYRAVTEMMVADMRFEEDRIKNIAEIDANLTVSVAKSNYLTVVRGARARALNILCDQLNVTSEELKNSLEYSQILGETNSVHMNVDYQPLFVKFRTP